MKVDIKRNPTKPVFEPVTLTIVLETPEEVQAAYDLGNHGCSVSRGMKQTQAEVSVRHVDELLDAIYRKVGTVFGKIGHNTTFGGSGRLA